MDQRDAWFRQISTLETRSQVLGKAINKTLDKASKIMRVPEYLPELFENGVLPDLLVALVTLAG